MTGTQVYSTPTLPENPTPQPSGTTMSASGLHAKEGEQPNLGLSDGTVLDFSLPMLPASIVGNETLDADDERVLNHIRAYGHVAMTHLMEAFILPAVAKRLRVRLAEQLPEMKKALKVAPEAMEHVVLLEQFLEAFQAGFDPQCGLMDPAEEVAARVLRCDLLAVCLLVLHLTWMTQRNYPDMVRDTTLEPSFRRLLHAQWLQECNHAQIDAWSVLTYAATCTAQQRSAAVATYLELLDVFEQRFEHQAERDLDSLERVLGRSVDREALRSEQVRALRRTYLGVGVTYRRVIDVLTQAVMVSNAD
ncbi:MAG: hypothetical protein AAFX99_07610 [Myxococcota bacterium]